MCRLWLRQAYIRFLRVCLHDYFNSPCCLYFILFVFILCHVLNVACVPGLFILDACFIMLDLVLCFIFILFLFVVCLVTSSNVVLYVNICLYLLIVCHVCVMLYFSVVASLCHCNLWFI